MRTIFTGCGTFHKISLLLLSAMVCGAIQCAAGKLPFAAQPLALYDNIRTYAHDTSGNTPGGVAYPVLYTNLVVPQGSSNYLADGVAAVFDNSFSAAVDDYDAIKLWNFGENIALVRDSYTLAIEFRPVPKLLDTLFLRLYLKQQPYALQLFMQNFAGLPGMKAWLEDTYLHTKTSINLQDTTLYNFAPNTDTLSYRNRFMVVFQRQLPATPVTITRDMNQGSPEINGVAAGISLKAGSVSIYPNPAHTGSVTMRFHGMEKGAYDITVYNTAGQKLASSIYQHDGNDHIYPLSVNASWLPGIYNVRVLNKNSGKSICLKLAISN